MICENEQVTIILVEDDQGQAELIKENLEESGITYPIIHCDNGQQAVDLLLGEACTVLPGMCVMLLDVNLPGLDGPQVLQALRANERTRYLPVYMLTTTENREEIQKCYELGCNSYITKPVEYEEFQESIRRLSVFLSIMKLPEIP